jgi:hypothetical protein
VLDLEPRGGTVDQRLTASVRIDNALAAAPARVFVTVFGFLADRKLTQGCAVSPRVGRRAAR